MSTTNFVDGTTVIYASWLNDVDTLVYDVFNGATTDSEARANLGVAIGTDVQAYDADLTTWAGVTPATGVTTFLTTPSSANLRSVVTDETGSGSLVFSDTPTLVSPLLGVPTSGTLTNCTGLPVSTGISGLGANVGTFLATPSSANLAAALTDETGSGAAVFATSPTLVTPTIGAATATSINKVAITSVATGATLTLTDNTTVTFPGETCSIGYMNIPQNSQSTSYTLVASDSGKHIFHPSADVTARTYTIPSNASVAYSIGTTITFINQNGAGVITIAINSDTMRLAGAGTTGSRTLAANGIATATKVTSTEWIINGIGLT